MDRLALDALIAECRAVAAASMDGALDYGLFGDPDAPARTVITLVRDRASGRPIAFNALPLIPVSLGGERLEVLHLGLVMVDPNHRSAGLSWILYGLTCFLLFVRRQLRPLWVSSVTQVPAVAGMVAETFDGVWPAAHGGSPSFAHRHIARQIMRDHRAVFGVGADAGFDDERFVITNAYTGGSDDLKKSFEDAPKHRQPRYNDFCANLLDYRRGDDLLQIGQINLATARRFLAEAVPHHALPQLGVQMLILVTQAVLAPAAQWLAADRPLGPLRPSL
ncbi:hypothetical protein [Sphingosinicella sp. BN140058]|uniref:hypothetical protein n=1 Tax=Sphingosinicella sp. BN140058 TaxID=1892855 RepID=UPI00197DE7EC|nr:hypothetical protein [Sphingosinicella sp. BN140058]